MVFTEFRIPLPVTVKEFQVAQLYMVIKASKENTKDGEGVEWVKNEPYDNTDGHLGISDISGVEVPKTKGQYTYKIYHLESHIPWAVKSMLSADAMILVEEAWNAYPHCKTVLTNGYLSKDKFRIIVETMHLADTGTTENALGLDAKALKKRKVEHLDICDLERKSDNYKKEYDPCLFTSEKTGRGALTKGTWKDSADPVMCCYKLVTADFKYWGLQTKVEGTIEGKDRDLFKSSLAQAFCLIDEWHGLTMADIRKLEAQSKEELNSSLATKSPEGEKAAEAESGAGAGSEGAGTGAGAAAAPAAAPAAAESS